jgi:hypothetical protein
MCPAPETTPLSLTRSGRGAGAGARGPLFSAAFEQYDKGPATWHGSARGHSSLDFDPLVAGPRAHTAPPELFSDDSRQERDTFVAPLLGAASSEAPPDTGPLSLAMLQAPGLLTSQPLGSVGPSLFPPPASTPAPSGHVAGAGGGFPPGFTASAVYPGSPSLAGAAIGTQPAGSLGWEPSVPLPQRLLAPAGGLVAPPLQSLADMGEAALTQASSHLQQQIADLMRQAGLLPRPPAGPRPGPPAASAPMAPPRGSQGPFGLRLASGGPPAQPLAVPVGPVAPAFAAPSRGPQGPSGLGSAAWCPRFSLRLSR